MSICRRVFLKLVFGFGIKSKMRWITVGSTTVAVGIYAVRRRGISVIFIRLASISWREVLYGRSSNDRRKYCYFSPSMGMRDRSAVELW